MDSILTSIKKLLGIEEGYEHFDADIIIGINSAIMALTQLGVGPSAGFMITSKIEAWSDFIGDRIDLQAVKSYVYLKTKLIFDPPTNSFMNDAIDRQLKEFEWRLNIQADPPVIIDTTVVDDTII